MFHEGNNGLALARHLDRTQPDALGKHLARGFELRPLQAQAHAVRVLSHPIDGAVHSAGEPGTLRAVGHANHVTPHLEWKMTAARGSQARLAHDQYVAFSQSA